MDYIPNNRLYPGNQVPYVLKAVCCCELLVSHLVCISHYNGEEIRNMFMISTCVCTCPKTNVNRTHVCQVFIYYYGYWEDLYSLEYHLCNDAFTTPVANHFKYTAAGGIYCHHCKHLCSYNEQWSSHSRLIVDGGGFVLEVNKIPGRISYQNSTTLKVQEGIGS